MAVQQCWRPNPSLGRRSWGLAATASHSESWRSGVTGQTQAQAEDWRATKAVTMSMPGVVETRAKDQSVCPWQWHLGPCRSCCAVDMSGTPRAPGSLTRLYSYAVGCFLGYAEAFSFHMIIFAHFYVICCANRGCSRSPCLYL